MTIKDYLDIRLSQARKYCVYGAPVLGVGIALLVTGYLVPYNAVLSLLGLFILLYGVFYGFYRVKCPCCGFNFGSLAYYHNNVKFELSKYIHHCPKCGVSIDEPYENC